MRPSTAVRLPCLPQQLLTPLIKRRCVHLTRTPRPVVPPSAASPRPLQPCLSTHPARNRTFMSSPKGSVLFDDPSKGLGMAFYDMSPERRIQWSLGSAPSARWGWVIYRTTYRPDLDRHRQSFKELIQETNKIQVAASDAPEIINRMDWVFVEDPSLEGASLSIVKHRFRNWVVADGAVAPEEGSMRATRHTYFIRVDEESLMSLLTDSATPKALSTQVKLFGAHVNMVQGWKEGPERDLDEFGDPYEREDWTKMMATMIAPYFYAELADHHESWEAHYMRPPHGISVW